MSTRNGISHFARAIRFGIVGIFGLGVYVCGTLSLSHYGRLSTSIASCVSFVVVVALNYYLHYFWTFESDKPHRIALPRFFITATGGMALNGAIISFADRLHVPSESALLLIGASVVAVWNYLLSRFWTFVAGQSKSKMGSEQTLS